MRFYDLFKFRKIIITHQYLYNDSKYKSGMPDRLLNHAASSNMKWNKIAGAEDATKIMGSSFCCSPGTKRGT